MKRVAMFVAMLFVCAGAFADADIDLYNAIKVKNLNKVQDALRLNANPNQHIANLEESIFNWAIENMASKAFVETMIYDSHVKVELNGSDRDFPVLFYALKAGRKDLIKILVKAGAEPNIDYYGQTPLIYATNLKKAVALNDFITECSFDPEKEIDLNLKDRKNNSALYYALKNKDFPSVKVLLKQGADITNIDEDGNDAICYAVKEKLNADIVDELLEHYDGDFTKLVYRSAGKYKNKNPIEIMYDNKTERMYEDIFNNHQ